MLVALISVELALWELILGFAELGLEGQRW